MNGLPGGVSRRGFLVPRGLGTSANFWYTGGMRIFLVFAIIALYIAVAFVPPSTQNLQAAMLELTDTKFFDGFHVGTLSIPGKNVDVTTVAEALKELATRAGSAQQLVTVGEQGKEISSTLSAAAKLLGAAASTSGKQVEVDMRNALAKQASDIIQNIGKTKADSGAWRRMLKAETDPVILEQLHIVQDAVQSGDVRRCGELSFVAQEQRGNDAHGVLFTPGYGDYLAYCLARVTGEGSRCDQISGGITPALDAVCRADFGRDV